MIGQKYLLRNIGRLIQNDDLPRFIIITGSAGGERNKIAQYIADEMSAICVEVPDCKADTIRDIILNSYKVEAITVYNIKDADSMSLQARNALLKVTEEPPNKAYFVMTLDDENNTLSTIRSRGTLFETDLYSRNELSTYCDDEYILDIAETPGDIDILKEYGGEEFHNFVSKVADNIAQASGSNALKIAQSMKLKDTEDQGSDTKYDIRLFWKAFCLVCMQNSWFNGLRITSQCLSLLRVKAINKAMLFDKWILDIRQEWADGNN